MPVNSITHVAAYISTMWFNVCFITN